MRHIWRIPQAVPQAPQFVGSAMRLRHTPPHEVAPVGHAQCPAVHCVPPEQTVPHAPQLLALVCVLTHAPPQEVSPPAQEHAPPEQNDPPKHPVPHAPQLRGSIWRLVQVPLHCVVPVAQMGWQVPRVHTWPVPQARPQAPQFDGSCARFVHPVEHGTCVPVQPHTPMVHDCPLGHA